MEPTFKPTNKESLGKMVARRTTENTAVRSSGGSMQVWSCRLVTSTSIRLLEEVG